MRSKGTDLVLAEFSRSPDYEVTFSCRGGAARLSLDFQVVGDIRSLYPEPLPPVRLRVGRDLWKRTCLEAFFFERDSTRYVELNWNVLGEYAVLLFEDYRRLSSGDSGFEVFGIEGSGSESDLKARLNLRVPSGRRYRLSPTAVLYRAEEPPLHYALAHGTRPDFHERGTVESSGALLV